jgi:hypothetical protein
MRNFFKLFGIIALVAVIGFSMAACSDDSDKDKDSGKNNNSSGGDSSSSNEKSIKITGLDEFNGSSFELGLASTIDKLEEEDLVAYAQGTIKNGTQTAALLDYKTDKAWTGSGSYIVGVNLDGALFVSKSKKSFNSSVTTLSIDDFVSAD